LVGVAVTVGALIKSIASFGHAMEAVFARFRFCWWFFWNKTFFPASIRATAIVSAVLVAAACWFWFFSWWFFWNKAFFPASIRATAFIATVPVATVGRLWFFSWFWVPVALSPALHHFAAFFTTFAVAAFGFFATAINLIWPITDT